MWTIWPTPYYRRSYFIIFTTYPIIESAVSNGFVSSTSKVCPSTKIHLSIVPEYFNVQIIFSLCMIVKDLWLAILGWMATLVRSFSANSNLISANFCSKRGENGAFPPTRDGCIHSLSVSVSAMLVSMRQKKYRSSFYSWAIFFCFHLSGSKSRYLLSGARGGIAAALFMISDIYLKKLTPCNLHEHASE